MWQFIGMVTLYNAIIKSENTVKVKNIVHKLYAADNLYVFYMNNLDYNPTIK